MFIMIDSYYTQEGDYWFSSIHDYCESKEKAEGRAEVLNSLPTEGIETSVVWSEGGLYQQALEEQVYNPCERPEDEDAKSCFEIAQAWEGEEVVDLERYLSKHGLQGFTVEGYGDLVGEATLEDYHCYIKTEVSDSLRREWRGERQERWSEWYTSR